jgi:ribosomal protein S6--L-glutamate ligase
MKIQAPIAADKKPVIGILTTNRREEDFPSSKRLMEEAKKAGYQTKRFDPSSIALMTDNDGLHFFYKGKKFDQFPFDVLVPRISSKPNPIDNYPALLDLKHVEATGIPVLNSSLAIENAEDKFVTHQLLAKAKLPQPRSLYSPFEGEVEELGQLKGDTLVLKNLRGCKGNGVEFLNRIDTMEQIGPGNFAQELATGPKGVDFRYLVVNGQVKAAMKRSSADGGFLSNASKGGNVEGVQPNPIMSDMAIKAAKALNLDVAGVDIMNTDEGPIVIEVNSTPGFIGLEKATGKNIAKMILDAAIQKYQDSQKPNNKPHLNRIA